MGKPRSRFDYCQSRRVGEIGDEIGKSLKSGALNNYVPRSSDEIAHCPRFLSRAKRIGSTVGAVIDPIVDPIVCSTCKAGDFSPGFFVARRGWRENIASSMSVSSVWGISRTESRIVVDGGVQELAEIDDLLLISSRISISIGR